MSIQQEMRASGRRVITTVPPGPDNPLGDRYITLRNAGFGLHGTNEPSSVFKFTTHGCIRLHPDDIRAVFDVVGVGWNVQIVYAPVLVAVDEGGRAWMEVNPDGYRRVDLETLVRDRLAAAGLTGRVDEDAVARCRRERSGRPCNVSPAGS